MRCLAAILVLCAQMTACAAAPPRISEYVDPQSGASITVVGQALTFALERSTLAVHARDYVSLVGLEVDRSGQAELYLIGYFWSTIDRNKDKMAGPGPSKAIELLADGRRMVLRPDSTVPKDLDRKRELLAPPVAHVEQASYPVSWEMLQYIAGSRILLLRPADNVRDDDEEADTFALWTDGRGALRAFTQRVGAR
jgi:hypothetical protein